MGIYHRLFWAQRIVILGLLVGLSMSFPLWFTERNFPLIPVIPGTFPLTQLASQIVFWSCIASLAASFIWTRTRFLVLSSVLLLFVIGMQDYNRLQPWYFQYFTVLVLLIPIARKYKRYVEPHHVLFAVQLAIASVYFFSGLFKFNQGFYDRIVPYMYTPVTNILVTYRPLIFKTGYLIPPFEIAIALGLFIPRIRLWAILGGSALHLGILVLLGPLGRDANSIIWPWNVALIALLWICFYKVRNFDFVVYLSKLSILNYVVILFVAVLPFLNLRNWYNEFIAYELYSGRSYTPHLRYHHSLVKKHPEFLDQHIWKQGDTVYINTYEWSMREYNVPPNSDWKVLREVQKETLKHLQ